MLSLIGNYNLRKILLIYKHESTNEVYIEQNEVTKGYLHAGKPLTERTASDLGKALYKERSKIITGVIPKNLLYSSVHLEKSIIIWRTEPCIKTLLFNGIPLKDGPYPIPALIWKYFDGHLSVLAINEKEELCYAPFGNVNQQGSVCMGSASKFIRNDRLKTFTQTIQFCETAFFNSKFTHFNEIKNGIIKGNILNVFTKLIGKKKFPDEVLNPAKIKIEDFYGKL
jgi:PRTRC genetic system protein B